MIGGDVMVLVIEADPRKGLIESARREAAARRLQRIYRLKSPGVRFKCGADGVLLDASGGPLSEEQKTLIKTRYIGCMEDANWIIEEVNGALKAFKCPLLNGVKGDALPIDTIIYPEVQLQIAKLAAKLKRSNGKRKIPEGNVRDIFSPGFSPREDIVELLDNMLDGRYPWCNWKINKLYDEMLSLEGASPYSAAMNLSENWGHIFFDFITDTKLELPVPQQEKLKHVLYLLLLRCCEEDIPSLDIEGSSLAGSNYSHICSGHYEKIKFDDKTRHLIDTAFKNGEIITENYATLCMLDQAVKDFGLDSTLGPQFVKEGEHWVASCSTEKSSRAVKSGLKLLTAQKEPGVKGLPFVCEFKGTGSDKKIHIVDVESFSSALQSEAFANCTRPAFVKNSKVSVQEMLAHLQRFKCGREGQLVNIDDTPLSREQQHLLRTYPRPLKDWGMRETDNGFQVFKMKRKSFCCPFFKMKGTAEEFPLEGALIYRGQRPVQIMPGTSQLSVNAGVAVVHGVVQMSSPVLALHDLLHIKAESFFDQDIIYRAIRALQNRQGLNESMGVSGSVIWKLVDQGRLLINGGDHVSNVTRQTEFLLIDCLSSGDGGGVHSIASLLIVYEFREKKFTDFFRHMFRNQYQAIEAASSANCGGTFLEVYLHSKSVSQGGYIPNAMIPVLQSLYKNKQIKFDIRLKPAAHKKDINDRMEVSWIEGKNTSKYDLEKTGDFERMMLKHKEPLFECYVRNILTESQRDADREAALEAVCEELTPDDKSLFLRIVAEVRNELRENSRSERTICRFFRCRCWPTKYKNRSGAGPVVGVGGTGSVAVAHAGEGGHHLSGEAPAGSVGNKPT